MTVATTSNRQDFTGTGSVGPISFPHRLDKPDELELWTRDINGLKETKAAFNGDYFVAVASDFGSATVTLSAPFAALVNGRLCSLLREVVLMQDLNVEQVQRFSDGELEKGYDRAVMRDQQLAERLSEIAGAADVQESGVSLTATVDLVNILLLQLVGPQLPPNNDQVEMLRVHTLNHQAILFK